jgi:hypothetical protein
MIGGIEEKIGEKLPSFDDPAIEAKLELILEKFGLECSPPLTTARMLDTLVGEFLEDNIVHPTFITEHPQIMSPLAKNHREKEGLTERFELFVCGREVSYMLFLRVRGSFVVDGCILSIFSGGKRDNHKTIDAGTSLRPLTVFMAMLFLTYSKANLVCVVDAFIFVLFWGCLNMDMTRL